LTRKLCLVRFQPDTFKAGKLTDEITDVIQTVAKRNFSKIYSNIVNSEK
jgi:hypothetical protein